MHAEARPSFAFLVFTYNHQEYILEHLESIKYLVLSHGAGIDVDVIVNDDCSKDQTRSLVDRWLQINAGLFRYVKTLYNPKNLGTCASVNNVLTYVVADRCKLTAGDDVYSFENIFELTKHDSGVAMVSGRALYLLGDALGVDRRSNVLATATQVIYQNDSLLHRFKHFSYNNAPNLQYATECLLHPTVRAYLQRFDVTEDWPLQVAIARQFPERRFKLIDEVLVYYRRTAGSTYIVANQRFVKDKILMYDDLIEHESNSIERLRLRGRKFCFKMRNRWVNKLLNLDLYFFTMSCVYRLLQIVNQTKALDMPVTLHQQHYVRIQTAAMKLRESLN
jgi:glycosyltransferase involved in cell wall biosynthesis